MKRKGVDSVISVVENGADEQETWKTKWVQKANRGKIGRKKLGKANDSKAYKAPKAVRESPAVKLRETEGRVKPSVDHEHLVLRD